jgi:hypothetical protein
VEFDFQSWGIGIATGAVGPLLTYWLNNRRLRKKQAEGYQSAVNHSGGDVEIEFNVGKDIPQFIIIVNVDESTKNESKS